MLIIKNLYKSYGKFLAVNGLDLSIEKGQIFGFVGPNGAGKTTTMRIVSGLLSADSGEITVAGINAFTKNRQLKEKIGYMPDFFGVYDNLKAIEYMEFYASIYGLVGKESKSICMDLLELVNLSDKSEFYVDSLSRGMKQRLCLARSLVHNPELLILDEPASGLDPRARFEMKEILRNLKDMGKTIIISSHILPELAELCTSIGIIEKGKMAISGTVEDILITINSSSPIKIKILNNTEKAIKILKESPLVDKVSVSDNNVTVAFMGNDDDSSQLLRNLIVNDVTVSSFTREAGNLETLFMKITESEVK